MHIPTEIVNAIMPQQHTLILIRGLPGSGKSTLAKALFNSKPTQYWCEADMYFIDKNGNYNFRAADLPKAHAWCQDQVRNVMINNSGNAIVSNTFVQRWEAKPYVDMATEYNYKIQLITCEANFGSIHAISDATIQRMRDRWHHTII